MTTRRRALAGALLVVVGACGTSEDGDDTDPPVVQGPGCPAVLEAGVHNPEPIGSATSICVFDPDTGQPVGGVPVHLDGNRSGLTGADGRVDFPSAGSRAVTVGATGASQTTWAGFYGTQWIIPYEADASVPAQVTGRIIGWGSLPPPEPGHYLLAEVTSTRRIDPTYRKNTLEQEVVEGIPQNRCRRDPGPATTCAWTLTTRPGRQRLIATIIDVDAGATPSTADDVYAVIGYADSGAITLGAGELRTDVELQRVPAGDLSTITFDIIGASNPPLRWHGELALDLGADGQFVGAFPPLVSGASTRLYPINADPFAGRYDLVIYSYGVDDDTSYGLDSFLDVGGGGGGYGVERPSMVISRCGHACWRLAPDWDLGFATFRRGDGTYWSVFQSNYSAGRILQPPGIDVLGEAPVEVTVRTLALDDFLPTVLGDFVLDDLVTDPTLYFGHRPGAGASGTFTP